MSNRLENRNAIITGAAQGMGLAIAKSLFNEGARVVIVDIDEALASARRLWIVPANGRSAGKWTSPGRPR